MEDTAILSPGQRLKKIRKQLKLRQEELAGSKFSKNYISMFENSKRNINVINAAYLAEQVNNLAVQKGKEIRITSSYFLKSKEDIAKEKCEHWINQVEVNLNLTLEQVYMNLYKTIHIATKYSLNIFIAKALYLKGIFTLQNENYDCSMTHFLEALTYFALENDFISIGDIYIKLGIILYKQGNYRQAIVYFNLAQYTLHENEYLNDEAIEDINYHKILCYYELGRYGIAQNLLEKADVKDVKLLELKDQLSHVSAS